MSSLFVNPGCVMLLLLGIFISSPVLGAPQSGAKQRWPVGRFLKTLTFFDALPKLPFFQKVTLGTPTTELGPGSVLFNMAKGQSLEFGPLDDIVMGGVSQTQESGLEQGFFSGVVSTANNGGFAGIRTKLFSPAKNIVKAQGIQLRVKGDGNRYKFIARDDTEWNGIAWSASFDTTKGKSTTVKIPIKSLKPTRFAKMLTDNAPFDQSRLSGIQITLSKFEYDGGLNPSFTEGPFSLQLEEIALY